MTPFVNFLSLLLIAGRLVSVSCIFPFGHSYYSALWGRVQWLSWVTDTNVNINHSASWQTMAFYMEPRATPLMWVVCTYVLTYFPLHTSLLTLLIPWKHILGQWAHGGWLTVVTLNYVLLFVCFFHVAQDHRGKLDLRRAGADQTTPGCQRRPHQHRVCTDPLRGEPAVVMASSQAVTCAPSYLWHSETTPQFCIFTCAFNVMGEPLLAAFWCLLRGTHFPEEKGPASPWPCLWLDPECKDSASESICWANRITLSSSWALKF